MGVVAAYFLVLAVLAVLVAGFIVAAYTSMRRRSADARRSEMATGDQ